MSDVPESPAEFFTQYIPQRFEAVKSGLAGKSSSGCMTFRVLGGGEWSLRLKDGELSISDGMADDAIIQITVSGDDFHPIFVQGAVQQEGEPIKPEAQVLAFKALTIDSERAKLVRAVVGSVAFVVADGEGFHKLVITPGTGTPKLEDADCRLECSMNDFMDMQTGKQQPLQLAMSGRIRIVGNAQIPMALSGVFA